MIGQPISLVYHNNYWDGPLSGVCKIEDKRYYFKCVHDYYDSPRNMRIYAVYELSNEEWKEEDYWHKLFEDNVGTHTNYEKNKRIGAVKPQEMWENFYGPAKTAVRKWREQAREVLGYFDRSTMKLRATCFRDHFESGDTVPCHDYHCNYWDLVRWDETAQFYDYANSESGTKPGWAVGEDEHVIGVKFCPECGMKMPKTFSELLNDG